MCQRYNDRRRMAAHARRLTEEDIGLPVWMRYLCQYCYEPSGSKISVVQWV